MEFAVWDEQEGKRRRGRRLRVAYTGRRKSAGSRQGLGVGRPRLSAIKIIPFLLAAERKELTSTLSRVPPGCYPLPLSSSPLPNSSYSPLSLSSSVVALVSIAILIVSSYARMTNSHGTVRNERTTLFFSRCGRRSKTSSMRRPRHCYPLLALDYREADCIEARRIRLDYRLLDNFHPIRSLIKISYSFVIRRGDENSKSDPLPLLNYESLKFRTN